MRTSIKLDCWLRLLVVVSLLVFLAGCIAPAGGGDSLRERLETAPPADTVPTGEAGERVMVKMKSRSRPDAHVWSYLYALGEERPGYATYSYVLAGHDDRDSDTTARYLKLVEEIRHSTSASADLEGAVALERLNLFLIPATKDDAGEALPNYNLSKALLTVLSANSAGAFSRPGPYLITLYKPLCAGDDGEIADILYVDFTNIHPDAIPEVVRTYKSRVVDDGVDGIERLRSLRLSLLNLALLAEDSIGFAKQAYAELVAVFPE